MGSPTSELGRDTGETEHQATITRSYYLKVTQVTQGEWRVLMGNDPSYFSSCGDDCPVERLSWWDGVAYLNALSQTAGLSACYTVSGCSGTPGAGDYSCGGVSFAGLTCPGYRYPTESEWEYAARAGTTTAFSTGAITQPGGYSPLDPALDQAGWYGGNSMVTYAGCYDLSSNGGPTCAGPQPVGQKQANSFGLYDMHGNVWEWVHDWHGNYSTTPVVDSVGAQSGANRVVRGGSWGSHAQDCRSAQRRRYDPGFRSFGFGFRPARTGP